MKITVHSQTFQEIHATIEVLHYPIALLSFVYASPQKDRRVLMWDNLKNIAESVSIPWLVGGDFNDYATADEKWDGKPASVSRMSFFQNAISCCGLSDLGFSGPKFTWWNKRPNGSTVFERLDRFLGNMEWINLFPENVVQHLPRFKSDHNPVLFISKPDNMTFVPRPFRCEKIWLKQPDFGELVNQTWALNEDTTTSLQLLQTKAQDWNKNVFGNIFHQKNILLKRIEGIHNALANGPNPFLLNLESELYKSLADHLLLIEDFWAAKSRVDWLNLGDENASFFHASVISRRRSNRISTIKNRLGEWLMNFYEIRRHIINYFQAIFSATQISTFPTHLDFPDLSHEFLAIPFIPTHEEIKQVLFSLALSKLQGKMASNRGFFKNSGLLLTILCS